MCQLADTLNDVFVLATDEDKFQSPHLKSLMMKVPPPRPSSDNQEVTIVLASGTVPLTKNASKALAAAPYCK